VNRHARTAPIEAIDDKLDVLAEQPFRAGFHLRGRERALVELRGVRAIRSHADDLIATRVAPANPRREGKQTPYRNHPVFVAQHATATCCRGCLERTTRSRAATNSPPASGATSPTSSCAGSSERSQTPLSEASLRRC